MSRVELEKVRNIPDETVDDSAKSDAPASPPPAAPVAPTSGQPSVKPAPQRAGLRDRILGLPGDPSRTRRLANILGVFLLVDALIAGIAIALLSGGSDSTPKATPASTAPTAVTPTSSSPTATRSAPVAWVQRELPSGAVVLADLSLSTQLTAAGMRTVVTPSASTTATVQYIVSTPALRAAARSDVAKAKLLAISAPIASFGSGSDAVVVREITGISSTQLAADRGIDAGNRHDAEQQLLDNRNLTTGKGVSAILQAGGLDMRAATVIVLLANAGPTTLTSIAIDSAEQAAGIPARRIVITTQSRTAVAGILDGLPQAYRPTSNVVLPNGAQRLVWPLDPDPTTN